MYTGTPSTHDVKPATDFVATFKTPQLAEYFRQYMSPWGKRRLKRFKRINGKLYQLHATRGWKAA